jgi:predicted HNH restriction endonuclease
MGKRQPQTPKSQIKAALHKLWLRSRERNAALKRENNTCELCGKKQSKAKGKEQKICVHHLNGIEWPKIIEYIYRHILVDPKHLEVLCPTCHEIEHGTDRTPEHDITSTPF